MSCVWPDGFTYPEQVVVRGVFAGKSNKQIAFESSYTLDSVKHALTSAMRKVGCRSRTQLVIAMMSASHDAEIARLEAAIIDIARTRFEEGPEGRTRKAAEAVGRSLARTRAA